MNLVCVAIGCEVPTVPLHKILYYQYSNQFAGTHAETQTKNCTKAQYAPPPTLKRTATKSQRIHAQTKIAETLLLLCACAVHLEAASEIFATDCDRLSEAETTPNVCVCVGSCRLRSVELKFLMRVYTITHQKH